MTRHGKVGRPSIAGSWAGRIREILSSDPGLSTAEVVRRLRGYGCAAGKTAIYHLVALCRRTGPGVKESGIY